MSGLHQIAAMALMSFGVTERRLYDDPSDHTTVQHVLFGQPKKATFESTRPLTKRQRRRMRGKGGAS